MQSSFRMGCLKKAEQHFNTQFQRYSSSSQTMFISTNRLTSLVCVVSKQFDKPTYQYWFSLTGFHKDLLRSSVQGYALFGCGDASRILLFPQHDLLMWLENTGKTITANGTHYHVQFDFQANRVLSILEGKDHRVDVTQYVL